MKKIYMITVFIILLALTIFLLKKPVKTTEDFDKNMFALDSAKVESIEIKGKKPAFLQKNGTWEIKLADGSFYKASKSKINNLISTLISLKVDNIITRNPEKRSKFEVDSTANRIIYKGENGYSKELIIGKASKDFARTYYREPGKNEIYVGHYLSEYKMNNSVDDWRDKTILSLNEDPLDIEVLIDSKTVKVSKDSTGFVSDSKEVKSDKLSKMVSKLKNLNCKSFASENLDKSDITVKFTNPLSRKKDELNLFKVTEKSATKDEDDKTRYYAKLKSNKQFFEISEYDFKPFDLFVE